MGLARLHPDFDDCPSPCRQADEDNNDLCGDCEVRHQWRFFTEGYSRQMDIRFGEEKSKLKWSFQTLYSDLLTAHKANRSVDGEGYPAGCTMLAARCLDILRQEERRPERMKNWEDMQKAANNG
ncbi:MAG: hypothetical protein MSG64_06350 [Pyrinomonadaceae bacterium MAG19_C2-C3]|nr:hypothetical protein [Pyrinomonadaceae bacterium MAG19_C2-C3]